MRVIFASLALLAITVQLAARDNTLSPAEAQQGWILLFDGQTEFGWTRVGGAQWRVANATILADSGDSGYLRTNSSFADFDLKCDFELKTDGKSGIFLRFDKEGDPEDTGYKLQIDNHDPKFPTGSLVGQLKSTAPAGAPNQWHTYEVQAEGDQFVVKLDGNLVLSGDGHKDRVGYIGLQFVRGNPVVFRNIKLKPLGLGSIFNGQNTYQWTEVGAQSAAKKKGGLRKLIPGGGGHPQDWIVEDGAIHVKKGPSELETDSAYGDFILQLDVRAEAHNKKEHPNGSVYVRADKATAATGYRIQIDNEYQGTDPTQPVGAGTGGLASIHDARRVVSVGGEYFKLTIAASGHHLATWVNGFQTIDFEDRRADGPDALIQARTAAGPIRLAADNPSSSLDFKGIEIAALPKSAPAAKEIQSPNGAPVAQAPISTTPPSALPPKAVIPGPPAVPAGNPHQNEINRLLQEAFVTQDAEKQIELYNKVLLFDNNNQAAISGRSQAQARLDQARAEQAQAEQQQAARDAAAKLQQEQGKANEATKSEEIKRTEAAIIAGNWASAAEHIAIAKKLAPNDPTVLGLDSRIQTQQRALRNRRWTVLGLISAGLVSLIALLVLTMGRKQPYLEILDGIEKGKRYKLDQDVMHIGAVAQDGGNNNEIVVTDLDHSISRFHCEIHRQNGKLWVLDCGSANGTYLDGHRVRPGKPVLLKKGGRLQLAEACTLRLGFEKPKASNS